MTLKVIQPTAFHRLHRVSIFPLKLNEIEEKWQKGKLRVSRGFRSLPEASRLAAMEGYLPHGYIKTKGLKVQGAIGLENGSTTGVPLCLAGL